MPTIQDYQQALRSIGNRYGGNWANVYNQQADRLGAEQTSYDQIFAPYNQAVGVGQQAAGMSLYDPATLAKLQGILSPYFNQQRANITQQFGGLLNRQTANAGNDAAAYAASMGYANPNQFASGAQARVRENLTPQYFNALGNLEESQLGSLLNAGVQSQQFGAGNLFNLAQLYNQGSQLGLNYRGQNLANEQFWAQMNNNPSFFENLFGGLISGGAQIGAAYLGRPTYNMTGGG